MPDPDPSSSPRASRPVLSSLPNRARAPSSPSAPTPTLTTPGPARSDPPTGPTTGAGGTTGGVTPTPPGLPPGALVGLNGTAPPPRASVSSMLFLTLFFFFMSGGNAPTQPIVVGPDGEFHRVTELDIAQGLVDEYNGWMNGTGNWTEPSPPRLLPSTIVPSRYTHHSPPYFQNITGFYREARVSPLDLIKPDPSRSPSDFFHGIHIPSINSTSPDSEAAWNETRAVELRGDFEWSAVDSWSMNLKERNVSAVLPASTASTTESELKKPDPVDPEYLEWTWVKGTATIAASSVSDSVEYDFYGLHHIPNGTYELIARPQGVRIDIRDIPLLYPSHHNVTSRIILAELEKELKTQQENLLIAEATPDDTPRTACRLSAHLSLPPLPAGVSPESIALYDQELRRPTGILWSLPRPPHYWDGVGLGGVVVADDCGWAYGIDGGKGVVIDDFWRKSVNYAAFATLSQLLVLVLLVRQMESTRTPSTLSKVSLWTIVMMGISDSWVFSAHVVVGIMSDNKSSLPMLVPGFLSLCTAIVFGPRYAILLHRIQAPERTAPSQTPAQTPIGTPVNTPPGSPSLNPTTPGGNSQPTLSSASVWQAITGILAEHPFIRWFLGATALFIGFQIAFLPSVIPFFLFGVYSIWVPQIWRNARRGNSHSLSWSFIIGTSVGRLALPVYAFACPQNVLFVKPTKWVWVLVLWQVVQIGLLFAQERLGPAFFLPKSLAPPESYNYHPLIPPTDPENPAHEHETTCSICMEEVDTRPSGPSGALDSAAAGVPGSALLGLTGARRQYALAPCHHLFHTKCLAQWLAIKTICPLCKRSLPPL